MLKSIFNLSHEKPKRQGSKLLSDKRAAERNVTAGGFTTISITSHRMDTKNT